ncbi:MAG TPA: cytochrome c [Pseudolabrys sp.]|jgi:mono/diheme cytochrome c family protein
MRCLVSLVLVVAATSASAQSQSPMRRGRAVVQEFCSPCHAVGKSRRSPHVGAPPFRTFSRSFDLDQFAQHLERGISSNHPDMPEFKFSEQDARDVSAYLRSI